LAEGPRSADSDVELVADLQTAITATTTSFGAEITPQNRLLDITLISPHADLVGPGIIRAAARAKGRIEVRHSLFERNSRGVQLYRRRGQ
jgi:hypothetical protein